ncbi:phage holin family protein [Serinicoccus kebangsaanensis]|uniref:phage holin family protein n=1 Tax=Serinicoccus kebangsaanensis TaxID=2602069 RepID=UPI001EE1937E|nr:phage holin family protein [Serinicoccus kebangsaanensis]
MAERFTPDTDHASTGELIARMSEQTSTLIRDEMRLAQAELSAKAKNAGVGIGMFGAGGLLAFFGIATLITTVILVLALVLPPWAAAGIVTLLLLAAAAVVSLVGKKRVQEATPAKPERAMDNVKQDIAEVKGAAQS